MEIEVSRIFPRRNPDSTLRCFSDFIVETCHFASENTCSLSLYSTTRGDDGYCTKGIAEWHVADASELSDVMAVDTFTKSVFVAHSNGAQVSVFSAPSGPFGGTPTRTTLDTGFEDRVAHIVRLDHSLTGGRGDPVALVSNTGKICVIVSERSENKKLVLPVNVHVNSQVLRVTSFGKQHVVMWCGEEGQVVLRILRLDIQKSEKRCEALSFPPITLPEVHHARRKEANRKRIPEILSCLLLPRCAFILFADGRLQLSNPPHYIDDQHRNGLEAWNTAQEMDESSSKGIAIDKALACVNLSPGLGFERLRVQKSGQMRNKVNHSDLTKHNGGLAPFGNDYVVVAFGAYASIWDGVYGIGHGYCHLKAAAGSLSCSRDRNVTFLSSDAGVQRLFVDLISDKHKLTLSAAVRRRGSCDAILAGDVTLAEDSPLRSQPVTVNIMKKIAESGGKVSSNYQDFLLNRDADDLKRVGAIVNRTRTPSAQLLGNEIKHLVRDGQFGRRGDRGIYADLGLSSLPSERIAAAAVARSLYEINEGEFEFLVPFLDMLGTGVVSNESVLAMLASARSWADGGPRGHVVISSISSVLTKSQATLYALEAMVSAVADLPESDLVRAAQFATRVYARQGQEAQVESESTPKKLATEAAEEKQEQSKLRLQSQRILLKCVVALADRKKLIQVFRRMPQHDVSNMLKIFTVIIKSQNPRRENPFFENRPLPSTTADQKENTSTMTRDELLQYRGIKSWLDKRALTRTGISSSAQELQGCIEWASLILDAHFASLVLDPESIKLVKRIRKAVRQFRFHCEEITPMLGAVEHIYTRRPLPQPKPVYSLLETDVPTFASLT